MGADEFIAYGDNEVGEVIEGARRLTRDRLRMRRRRRHADEVDHARRALRQGHVARLLHASGSSLMPAMGSYKCVHAPVPGRLHHDGTSSTSPDQMDKGHTDPKAIITKRHPLIELPAMFDRAARPQ
jgi:(R,R)-butanediol dehydrogenase/meso-butanediol dehydrogenase/diacetyl reductase